MGIEAPYFPIIYIRGYAMTKAAVAETVNTPYMGFNLGSTKIRQEASGDIEKHIFESPLVRLMKEYGYTDHYRDGKPREGRIEPRSVVIHRYYDAADPDFGTGRAPSIEDAARALSDLVLALRDQVCGDDATERERFRVYLVAHSMGGLIARCFLQNDDVGDPEAKGLVDKLFTYGTPHNGIEIGGRNVSSWMSGWDADNFNRARMAEYLDLPAGSERVDDLGGKFDPERVFCMVGTNHTDYGYARFLVGPRSDGLVKIANATVRGAPRAFAFLSHSGPHGLVNSEEGYQNLIRFLFGDCRATARLHISALPLPPSIVRERERGSEVRASYLFECDVRPRGASDYRLSDRNIHDCSAVFRRYDEVFTRSPVLFSTFLDSSRIVEGEQYVFTIDLAVRSTDYVILARNVRNELRQVGRVPGQLLFRDQLTVGVTRSGDGFRFVHSAEDWEDAVETDAAPGWHDGTIAIPLSSRKGFDAQLSLEIEPWNGEWWPEPVEIGEPVPV